MKNSSRLFITQVTGSCHSYHFLLGTIPMKLKSALTLSLVALTLASGVTAARAADTATTTTTKETTAATTHKSSKPVHHKKHKVEKKVEKSETKKEVKTEDAAKTDSDATTGQ